MERIIQYLESKQTEQKITQLIKDNLLLYKGINTKEKIQHYSGLVYNQFVNECVQNNQYISLSNESIDKLNTVYIELIDSLRSLDTNDINSIDSIVKKHRRKIISIIKKNTYDDLVKQIVIPCSEYTGEFQNEVLRIDTLNLLEPILDIGCGNKQELVKLLRRNGYQNVYGLDQYISTDLKIICSNWFEYVFNENTWGCIIAHMSFSNHLRRVVINNEDNLKEYINKYNELLNALCINGMFIYTPSVKSIEDTIDRQKWSVVYFRNVNDRSLDTVHIKRIP